MKFSIIKSILLLSLFISVFSCKEDMPDTNDTYKRDISNIQLDYDPNYGDVSKNDMPVYLGLTEDLLFQRIGHQKEDFSTLSVREHSFTGIALVEHLSPNGEMFNVWHEYENESVVVVEGELLSGEDFQPKAMIQYCSNGLVYDEHFNHWRPMTFDDVFWNWVNNGAWPY